MRLLNLESWKWPAFATAGRPPSLGFPLPDDQGVACATQPPASPPAPPHVPHRTTVTPPCRYEAELLLTRTPTPGGDVWLCIATRGPLEATLARYAVTPREWRAGGRVAEMLATDAARVGRRVGVAVCVEGSEFAARIRALREGW